MARQKKKRKMFHASVQVTRMEDWCVEAESEEEARALLASGAGERCGIGDCVYVEVQNCSECRTAGSCREWPVLEPALEPAAQFTVICLPV